MQVYIKFLYDYVQRRFMINYFERDYDVGIISINDNAFTKPSEVGFLTV